MRAVRTMERVFGIYLIQKILNEITRITNGQFRAPSRNLNQSA
jgi:hypothetical protein